MWRTTGDVKWREHGYKIFQAIEKHTRTKFGYTTVGRIDGIVRQLDDMPRYIHFIYYTPFLKNICGLSNNNLFFCLFIQLVPSRNIEIFISLV